MTKRKKKDILEIINESNEFTAFEVDKDSKNPVGEFWGKMDKIRGDKEEEKEKENL